MVLMARSKAAPQPPLRPEQIVSIRGALFEWTAVNKRYRGILLAHRREMVKPRL